MRASVQANSQMTGSRQRRKRRHYMLMKAFFFTAIAIVGGTLSGCGGYSMSSAGAAVTLSASPSTYAFPLDGNSPQPITVTRSNGTFTSVTLSVSDPTIVGVTTPLLAGGSATFSVLPIARGSASITIADSSGAQAQVNAMTPPCGRPPNLLAAQQLSPSDGAGNVSTSVGKIYFSVYFLNGTSPSGNLHLIVQPHATLEGGPLTAATPPPGTVFPTPIPLPNATAIEMSASVPPLQSGAQYEMELYNDTCQQAVLAGTFST